MNNVLSIVLSVCMYLGMFQGGAPFQKVDQAFDGRNAEALVSMAREKILIKYNGKEGIYSKPQAIQIIKEFFVRHPKGTFDYTFKGTESAGGTFAIGNYIEGQAKYRVTIHFKNGSDGCKIESLTIE